MSNGEHLRRILAKVAEGRRGGPSAKDEAHALDLALRALGVGHWRYDFAADRVFLSDASKETLGIGADEEVSSIQQLIERVPPDERALIDEALAASLSPTHEYVADHQTIRPSGEVRWMTVRGRVTRERSGPVLYAAALDITEQKRIEAERERLLAELSTERARLRTVIDQLPAAVLVGEAPAGRLVIANRRVEDMFPHAPRELPTDSIQLFRTWDARYPDGRSVPAEDRPLSRALRGDHVAGEDYRYVHHDGTEKWLRLSSAPIRDEHGTLLGAVTVGIDIDREKRFEAERESLLRELARSERRYRLAALATEDAIYDWDIQTNTVSVQRMFGHAPETFDTFERWQDLLHPADRDRVVEGIHAVIASRDRHWQDEYRLRDADGKWLTVVDRGYVDRDAAGRALRMVGAIQDVTARRRQEEFERQLIGIVSHDLKNPLNTILLAAGMVARSEDIGAGAVRNTVRIQGAAERAIRMIRDLLDFTRARIGPGIPIDPRRLDVGALFQKLVEETRVGHPARLIAYEASGNLTGAFDADRLAQVLTNLVENAVRYSPPSAAVRVTVCGTDDEVRLAVHNQGPAISADLLPRIFEPLQRGDTAFDSAGRNVGLGLYIVKHLVDAHRGRIEVHSSDVDGTEFVVYLPRSDG